MSDRELMQIQVSVLFQLNDQGRLLAVNEPDPPAAPRLFVGRTRAGDVWWFRHDLPESVVHELETLLRAEPVATELTQRPRCFDALRAVLGSDALQSEAQSGPAWRFSDELAESEHDVVRITAENDAVVRDVFRILAEDLPWRQPCLAIVKDGRLASMCYSARNTTVAAEAGVDTLEEFRGRGYAAAVTTAWARAVRAEGRIPLYSTSWDNLASQSVARKLGLVLYGADLSIT